MKIFDSHAHYDDGRFESEFEGGSDAAIRLSFEKGICGIINVGTNKENARNSLALAEKYSPVYAAVGYHPIDCQAVAENDVDKSIEECFKYLSHPKAVAIGEIGLDYHYEGTMKERQKYVFERQLEYSLSHDIPVIIHDRDAHGDCLDIVKKYKGVRGVFHSFSGSAEMARELLKLGWYISFSGPVSYKNADNVKRAAGAVPLDRVLIETDCPYLPPVPHRGEINYSAYMYFTLEALANAMGKTAEEVANATVENTKKLFGI